MIDIFTFIHATQAEFKIIFLKIHSAIEIKFSLSKNQNW